MVKLEYATPSIFVHILQEEIVRTSGVGEEVGTDWIWKNGGFGE